MDYDLGTARGRIEIDYDGNGINEADRSLRGLGGSVSSTGEALNSVGNAAGVAGLGIAAGLAVAVKSAASFEQGLSNIQAVSGATTGEMEKLRAKALQVGKDTSFGANDAALAMEELAKAGLSTSDILNGATDATVALAAAGEVDLPFAAEIASNALNQFSLSAEDLPNVADKIAGAANASAISVEDFGYSLSQVGAVANLAGLSFDDTAIAIAQMGNAGIKGSDAGTSLKTMLSNLQPTTDKAKGALEEMGIITEDGTNKFYDQEGQLKSLRDIQELLNKGTKGYTSAQKQAALQTIFGSDAIRAAAILTKEGADGYDKMAGSINKVKAADVAATKMDNLNGTIEELKGSAETLGIQLGTVLLPVLADMAKQGIELLNMFLNLSDSQQEMIVKVLVGISAFLLFVAATIKIVAMMRQFIAILRVLRAALALGPLLTALRIGLLGVTTAVRAFSVALLANPIGLVVLAVIAFIAILVLLYKKNETVRNIINAVWAAIKKAVGATLKWFTETLIPGVISAWNKMTAATRKLGSDISNAWNTLKQKTTAFINAVKDITRTGWNLIKQYIITPIANAYNTVVTRINAIRTAVSNGWNAVKSLTSAAWKQFVNTIATRINSAMNTVRGIRGRVQSALSGAGQWLVNAGKNIIRGLINGITSALGSLRSTLGNVTNMIPDWKGPPKKDKVLLEQNGELIMKGLLTGIGSQLGPLRALMQGMTNDIPSWVGGAMSARSAPQIGAAVESTGLGGAGVTVNNYNPVAEPSSVTTTKAMTKLAQLGVLG